MDKNVQIIGDIHGRSDWEKILGIALPKFYHIVFLGDYVDSFDIRPRLILDNFRKILGYKKKYPDRITLLLGNHDYAYIDDHITTSGYNHIWALAYKEFFQKNREYFDVAWGHTNNKDKYTLATHAGLTQRFYNNYILPSLKDSNSKINKLTNGRAGELKLHEIINLMRDDQILWKVGGVRGGAGTPGPLWADYTELLDEPYVGINQVFGHTAIGSVSISLNNGEDLLIKVDGELAKGTSNILLKL